MIFGIVPVKLKSDRVKNKNFRDFNNGLSIFDIKLNQLIQSKKIQKILISSNYQKLSSFASVNEKIFFEKRKEKFCSNNISWSEMIFEIINSKKIRDNDLIVWCHSTSPFFNRFDEAIKCFVANEKKGYDSLVGVQKFNGFLLNETLNPINYSWGAWHKYSQYLDNYYLVNGSIFIGRKKTFISNKYLIGLKPQKFLCSDIESIDLDTELDFKFAQHMYKETYD